MRIIVLTSAGAIIFFSLLLLLVSCQPIQPEQPVIYPSVCGDGVCSANEISACDFDCNLNIQQEPEPVIQTPQDVLAELRSRQRNYPEEIVEQPNPGVQQDTQLIVESFTTYLPEKDFRVASRYNLLGLGENITSIMGVLTGLQLRQILASGSLRSNTQAFGPRLAMYEQLLRLKQGKVVFGYDRENDIVSTYLLLQEETPIFDYLLQLHGGIFKFFEGQTIHFLGHDYVIEQVNPSLMKLVGTTTPDTITFVNQSGVIINGRQFGQEEISVTLNDDYLRILINAPDELKILPGTSLRNYLQNPEILLTNRIDLEYEGLTEVPAYIIKFDMIRERYRLSFTTNKNMSYTVPLAYLNPFKTGDDENSFVFKEGASSKDYVIKAKDWFVVTNNKKYNGLTNIIRLINVDEKNQLITFEDPALEKFLVYFQGTPGANATAELIIDRVVHKVYVGANDEIAVDLDGNGRIGNDIAPMVAAGNAIIIIRNATDEKMSISIITPHEMRENNNSDLEVKLSLNNNGIIIDKNTLKMIEEPYSNILIGMTEYGAGFFLENDVNKQSQLGADLLINYPIIQRFADVIVKAYE